MNTNNSRANPAARQGLTAKRKTRDSGWEHLFESTTIVVARALIGARLTRVVPPGQPDSGTAIVGRIVETEAYLPLVDPACHGYRGPTARNSAIFGRPGRAYVYFIYGNHYCFNVTTEPPGIGAAVLVRALEPVSGLDAMRRRRPPGTPDAALASGPGNLCRAFAIDGSCDGADLRSGALALALPHAASPKPAVVDGPRIGIHAATRWPLRFVDASSASVSPFRRRLKVRRESADITK